MISTITYPERATLKKILVGLIFIVFLLVPIIVYTWLVMGPYAGDFELKNTRAVAFILAAALGTVFFRVRCPSTGWMAAFAKVLILYAAFYKAATYLPEVSTLPWSLGWSEGSRFYNASLFFSDRIYGFSVPLPVLHPSRYLLQSLPFMIPDVPLWVHRLWQVFLWLGMSLWAGFVLSRRFKAEWGFALFSLLFLFQGPVYYHLLVMVIIVVWGFDARRFGRTLLVVLLASVWAGISRINWVPVPGLIAAALYFMETPVQKNVLWRYLLPAFTWTVFGSLTAYAAQNAYMHLSGNPLSQFGSSFSSDLLWYRLWPNATFNLGILRSTWRVSFPILLIILTRWLPNIRSFHWLRVLGLGGILAVLFAGGVLVSVKIGGGSNLHNLDAYLMLLLLVGSGFYFHKVNPEQQTRLRAQGMLWPLVFFALLIPIRDLSQVGGELPAHNLAEASEELAVLKQQVVEATRSGGEVLFIHERQLLATQTIEGVPLVPDYEVVFLMEMAMGNNKPYLAQFYNDLRSTRFALIVTARPNPNYQDPTWAFAEENNIWVDRVTQPLLCYYESGIELPDSGLSLLVPRDVPCD